MAKKRKAPARAADCKTLADKIAFSQMVREQFEGIPFDAPPSAHSDMLDRFPYDPAMPWTHPEYAAGTLRTEAEKQRLLRRK